MVSLTILHPADAWQRLDRFIRKYLPSAPLGWIFKMLRTGKIKVNGKKKDQTYKLEINDEISFWLTDIEISEFRKDITQNIQDQQSEDLSVWNNSISLEILYEDEYLIVLNKAPWINVHAGDHKTKESNVIDQVQDYLKWNYDSLTFRPALVHRIDRDTSGCLLIAKDKSVLETLLSDLQSHKIEKVYHTIVSGVPIKNQDTIRARLLRIENAKSEAKVQVHETGQSAVTHYKVLNTKQLLLKNSEIQKVDTIRISVSLVECRIETGRTHQIRVHMAHIWYPVIADKAYGNKSINSYIRRNLDIDRQLLHAYSLMFIHPKTQKKLHIIAPYPSDFLKITTS
jgi:23S rRNA pseudouridine955/2504/2580 synthase